MVTTNIDWNAGRALLPEMAPDFHLPSYLGGIVDGESYIGISKGNPPHRIGKRGEVNPSYRELITVEMCDELPVKLLSVLFGTPYHLKQYSENRRPIYTWRPARLVAYKAASTLCPYLIIKRAQAETVKLFRADISLKWLHEPHPAGRCGRPLLSEQHLSLREQLFTHIKALNNVYSSTEKIKLADDFHMLSYMGGMFDAEGSFSISKACFDTKDYVATRHAAIARVEMLDGRIPMMFKYSFGGSVHTSARIYPNYQIFSTRWVASCNIAINFAERICPYLLVRHRRAEIIIESRPDNYSRRRVEGGELSRRERCRQEMLSLNKKPFKRCTV